MTEAKKTNYPTTKPPTYVRIPSRWFRENAEIIIKEFDNKSITALTYNNNSKARSSEVFLWDIWKLDLSDLQKTIIYKFKEIFIEENKKYQFDLDYSTINVQYTRYPTGGYYQWHSDDDFGVVHKRHQNVRKLSITSQLNTGEFEGGDLQLQLNYQKEPRTMRFEPGDSVVFPSFIQHQVTPVTKGIRYSLISWVSGPAWR
tara:strand:- start:779 stop:1381 length:603 start_codon:yes stop_codon:yes gene_type:complete